MDGGGVEAVRGAGPTHPLSQDADLEHYRRQLEDWVTCPSAKTPAGQAKIKSIETHINAIKHQMKKVEATAPVAHKVQAATAVDASPNAKPAVSAQLSVGHTVDVHA